MGSATLLGPFKVERQRLVIELPQIEGGGGEGVYLWVHWQGDMPSYDNCQESSGLFTRCLVPNQISNSSTYSNVEVLS